MKSEVIPSRVKPDIAAAARKAAAAEQRSLSALINMALAEWLRERGYLKIEGRKK